MRGAPKCSACEALCSLMVSCSFGTMRNAIDSQRTHAADTLTTITVAESAITVGFPHDVKCNALHGYVIFKDTGKTRNHDNPRKEINQIITEHVGPMAKLDEMQFTEGLPTTCSGKIMQRISPKMAHNDITNSGDTSAVLNPEVVDCIIEGAKDFKNTNWQSSVIGSMLL